MPTDQKLPALDQATVFEGEDLLYGVRVGSAEGNKIPAFPFLGSFTNLLIDGAFTVNQRTYVSAATLASGAYGHDRWKGGASGGDYSFTQLPNATQITIASGKSLIQVVEDKNVVGGDYVLSWEGTAQGRYAVDSDTPAGAYADSPIAISSQTAGTTMSVEFDDGTLGKVQLEVGAVATEFENLPFGVQLEICKGYYREITSGWLIGHCISAVRALFGFRLDPPMIAVPTITETVTGQLLLAAGTGEDITAVTADNITADDFRLDIRVSANLVAGNSTITSDLDLKIESEL